jgi:anti-anti-sigma regulatory factor
MATIALMLRVDGERAVQDVEEAREKLAQAHGELVLDFSSVTRLDPSVVRAMQTLTGKAEEAKVRVVLRGVNVDLYKVLKLANLAPRFSFMA